MATRHPRITVFGGAFASLVVMSILSAALGRVILGFIPKVWTLWAAAILFLVFGIKMLQEGLTMSSGSSHIQDEMREVEEELEEDASRHDFHNSTSSIPLEALEEGKFTSDMPSSPSSRYNPKGRHWVSRVSEGARNAIQVLTNPVFAQAFILTFLGEWGDRSQITTIAMGGAHSVPVIAFGTIVGHGVCTLGAVMGGRYLSTKISVKHITLIGAAAFLIFALLYIREAWVTPYSDVPEVPAGWR
ncbi:vacuolar protein [Tremella mesenterica]|uniref:GDT1 family protein n=1 Tax=Tremella mesenterica TaxID=5217 RepID=A0A4Q1BJD2_TREME|nr:vacuolar protein [Tremella mesenterica]